ncbi:MAG: OsmC family protein [Pseudolabrys sp.]
MSKSMIVNGVDTARLFGTIEAVKADPSLARFQFRLSNQWVGGGENRSRIDDFYGANQEMRHKQPFFLINDEPDVLLSDDRGPNPVEYVLHALAGCLTTSLVYHAAARGIEIRGVTTRFEGELDLRGFLGISKDVRRGYSGIRVMFDIDADCDDASKRELVAMGEAYSPVFDIVSNGVPVVCALDDKMSKAKAA